MSDRETRNLDESENFGSPERLAPLVVVCSLKRSEKLQMPSPTTDLIDWLKSQPQEIQSDVASMISNALPGMSNDPLAPTDQQLRAFYSAIENHGEQSFSTVGFLLSFRAIFDFLFAKRGRAEHWDEPKAMFMDVLASDDPQRESMKANAKFFLDDIPRKMSLWKKACAEWEELKATSLSDTDLEIWEIRRVK
jgi:hypothetical protein